MGKGHGREASGLADLHAVPKLRRNRALNPKA